MAGGEELDDLMVRSNPNHSMMSMFTSKNYELLYVNSLYWLFDH